MSPGGERGGTQWLAMAGDSLVEDSLSEILGQFILQRAAVVTRVTIEPCTRAPSHRGGKQVNARDSNVFTHSPFDRAIRRKLGDPMNDSQVAIEALIVADDLSVVFQPIVRLATGEVFAYEALTRCAVRPYRDPTVLFERAADSGCCGRLGRMVREIAVPLCSGVPVFLNVHPRELEDRWIVRPDDPVFAHDRTVYIEVTESVPLMHFELCRSVLRELRQRTDARLVIDDLGAGFSNLKLITELEPDVVKLDRSLVMRPGQERATPGPGRDDREPVLEAGFAGRGGRDRNRGGARSGKQVRGAVRAGVLVRAAGLSPAAAGTARTSASHDRSPGDALTSPVPPASDKQEARALRGSVYSVD